jgi:hypothetical protein
MNLTVQIYSYPKIDYSTKKNKKMKKKLFNFAHLKIKHS